jgi:plastocyanin
MKAVTVLKFRFLLGLAASFLPLAAAAATHEVDVGPGLSFSPNDLTIQVGDTVHWSSAGGTHDVKADDGSFSSGNPSSSINFSRTFNSVGEILYYCSVHSSPGQNINTFMNGRITVQSGGGGTADLAVQSVDAQNGAYAPGDSIPIDISIQNMGNAASTAYTVTFYASTNSTINGSDTEIGSSNRSALPAGQMSNFSIDAAFPNSIADGSYFIGAIIEISDSNAANNTGIDNTAVTVASPSAAELALTEVSAPSGSFVQGANISIDAEVDNSGNAASGAFSIKYYASTNSSINTSDRLIGTENRASLGAGEDSSGPFNATIPADLAPGVYFIGAIVDFDDDNSANNVNVDQESIMVTATGAFAINNGLNDTWRDISTRGQGFFVTVFPDIQKMFVGWFTYDVERPAQGIDAILGEPGHRWVTAFGSYSGDTATLDIEFTQGGIFNSGIPAPVQSPYGTLTINWSSCSEALATYDIPSVPISGTVAITRVANDNVARCESLSPP